MNLTSKRLLALTAAVSGFALCASAWTDGATYINDTFEDDESWQTYNYWGSGAELVTRTPTNGMSILDYKKQVLEGNVTVTNWAGAETDASTLTNAAITWADVRAAGANTTVPGTNGTLGAATSARYLNMSTEGGTLARKFSESVEVGETSLYVDTMIQFTASEEAPSGLGNDVRMALWVNKTATGEWGENALMLYAKDIRSAEVSVTNFCLLSGIDLSKWYRLTIETRNIESGSGNYFSVKLDGVALTNPNGLSDSEMGEGSDTEKRWFFANAALSEVVTLKEVAFTGTGAIDDLIVTTAAPVYEEPVGVLFTLTLKWGEGIAAVVQDGTTYSDGTAGFAVQPDKEVTVLAADWYDFAVPFTLDENVNLNGEVTYDAGNTNAMFTVSSVANADTVCVLTAVKRQSGDMPIGPDGKEVNAAKAADWATKNSVSMKDFASKYTQYLMNVAAETDASTISLNIQSVVAGDTETTITVKAQAGDNSIDLSLVNGTIAYQASDDLTQLSTATVVSVELSAGDFVDGTATVKVPVTAGKFIKAWVK